jgi:hypothetical protein
MDYLSGSLGIRLRVADFLELPQSEVRRISLPRAPVNGGISLALIEYEKLAPKGWRRLPKASFGPPVSESR